MYDIRFKGSKAKKDYKKLTEKLSSQVKSKLENTLRNNPYPRSTHGENLCKVEKKGKLYCIEVTGGDRVLYDIVEIRKEDLRVTFVHFAGNDDGEIRYLKKYAK